jgi:hypothetical protein
MKGSLGFAPSACPNLSVPRRTAEMNHRPLAVRLIALYLWLEAAALAVCVISVHLHPSVQSSANGIIEGLAPLIMALKEPEMDVWLAPLFALVFATLGTGVWFLQKWARAVIVVNLALLYGGALLGLPVTLALYSKDEVFFKNPSVYFDINLVAGIMILAALCDPDVKRAFRAE